MDKQLIGQRLQVVASIRLSDEISTVVFSALLPFVKYRSCGQICIGCQSFCVCASLRFLVSISECVPGRCILVVRRTLGSQCCVKQKIFDRPKASLVTRASTQIEVGVALLDDSLIKAACLEIVICEGMNPVSK